MTPHRHAASAAIAALLCAGATAAFGQVTLPPPVVATYTLVSAPLPLAEQFRCQVTNVSSQPVTLSKLQIHSDTVLASATCAGVNATLSPGQTCKVQTPYNQYPGTTTPHCRAQFLGTRSGALTGSLHSTYSSGGSSPAAVVVPMQLVEGITLAP